MEKDFEIRKLEARISNLESQVTFLLRVAGLELSKLRTAPDEELLKYYRDATQLLGLEARQFAPEVCELWAELFCQLSEFEFVRLQEIVDYEHTWEPFYNLVIRMMTAVRRAKGFMRNGTLKQLYAYLEKGRKSLRDSAVIMIKKSDRPQELPQVAQTLLKDNLIAV